MAARIVLDIASHPPEESTRRQVLDRLGYDYQQQGARIYTRFSALAELGVIDEFAETGQRAVVYEVDRAVLEDYVNLLVEQ